MKHNHAPIYITHRFPTKEDTAAECPRQDSLLLPEHGNFPCPLIVLIEEEVDRSQEAALLNSQGYAVFRCQAHRSMERSKEDCLRWQQSLEQKLDALLGEHPQLDGNRLYLDGWLAAFVIFHSHRFRAAVQRPALLDRASAYGCCSRGWEAPFGDSLREMLRVLTEQSVIVDADSCKTPLLVLHPLADRRYPPEQSEILYSMMKDRNPEVPCRLAVFPETASPERISREVTEWWKRFDQEVPHG